MKTLITTTELEAVNLMLGCINEAPVNSLVSPTTPDASIAANILRETTRTVQARGWSFNTEYNYTLTRDGSDNISIPSNATRVKFSASVATDAVTRGLKVYDRKNHTFVFSRDLIADEIVLLLPFDQMPETARHYTALKAARLFVDRSLGSNEQHGYTQAEELVAYNDFLKDESLVEGENFFNNASTGPTIIRRPNQSWLQ